MLNSVFFHAGFYLTTTAIHAGQSMTQAYLLSTTSKSKHYPLGSGQNIISVFLTVSRFLSLSHSEISPLYNANYKKSKGKPGLAALWSKLLDYLQQLPASHFNT